MKKATKKKISTLNGITLFSNVVKEMVNSCVKNTPCEYDMVLQFRIREGLQQAYELGKKTTRAYYKSKQK